MDGAGDVRPGLILSGNVPMTGEEATDGDMPGPVRLPMCKG